MHGLSIYTFDYEHFPCTALNTSKSSQNCRVDVTSSEKPNYRFSEWSKFKPEHLVMRIQLIQGVTGSSPNVLEISKDTYFNLYEI